MSYLKKRMQRAKEHLICVDKECIYSGSLPDVIHISDAMKIMEETKKDMENHSLTLKIESAFVNPPAKIETLKAIPLSIWEKWFGDE